MKRPIRRANTLSKLKLLEFELFKGERIEQDEKPSESGIKITEAMMMTKHMNPELIEKSIEGMWAKHGGTFARHYKKHTKKKEPRLRFN